MYYVYILQSQKDGSLYIGFTGNLKNRVNAHNQGKALSTRYKRPYKPVFYECFFSKKDAKSRERYLKSGWGRRSVKKILKNTLNMG